MKKADYRHPQLEVIEFCPMAIMQPSNPELEPIGSDPEEEI